MTIQPDDPRLVLAWIQAWRLRCCPPDTILAGELTPGLAHHLQHCPYCRQDREEALPPPSLDLAAVPAGAGISPLPGELWSLAATSAGWGAKDRYYSPPVVLVMDVVPDSGGIVVVQTYGDMALAGPDDIALGNGCSGFAEPWNRYTVRTTDLAMRMGRVSDQCAAAVRKALQENACHAPEEGSLLWFFRQVEVETGYHFTQQALAGVYPLGNSTSTSSLSALDPDTLAEDLRLLPVRLPEIRPGDPPDQLLARTMPADDLLPLAAAGQAHNRITILFFTVLRGRIREVRAVPGELTLQAVQDGMLQVSGRCDICPVRNSRWIFRWQSREWSIEPLPGQHGMADGVFWAVFPVADLREPEKGELTVRVLLFPEEGDAC